MNQTKSLILLAVVVFAAITLIHPLYPQYQALQHAGTVIMLAPLLWDSWKNKLPLWAFLPIVCFVCLHILGARYIYSYVPYKEWAVDFGLVDADFFQDPRNHFDRLVHFSFGLCFFPLMYFIARSWMKQQKRVALFMAWLMIQTFSMVYEQFEWLLTVFADSEAATDYNGQQGDWWDAQKDMALAMVGSTIVLLVIAFCKKKRRHQR